MKEIPLTQGLVALIDDEYFEEISKYTWHAVRHKNTFYAARSCGRKSRRELMHWYVAGKPLPGYVTDHIDRNGLNNCNNTRTITQRQNLSRHQFGVSKFPGTSWHKTHKKWIAYIEYRGHKICLGDYDSEFKAFCAYRYAILFLSLSLLPEWEECYNKEILLNDATLDKEYLNIRIARGIEKAEHKTIKEQQKLTIQQEAVQQWANKYYSLKRS